LEGLFPPDSPLLENNPKIVEIDQVKLLIEEYTRLDDGRKVEICPCTMIFMPDGSSADVAERRRRSVILEASKAVLEFDQPFVLRQAKVGRLVSGELKGRITIRSQGRSPGPEDDLMVVTRDVDLNEERIWTEHPVDFRLGSNYGRGRQMWIKLLPGDEDEGTGRRGPNVAGIELFEIRRLEQLHLRFGDEKFVPGVEKKTRQRAAPGKSDLASDLPVEVKCRGPFRFDPIQQVATFEDHVDVLRVHPEGPSDQINCETLTVYFSRPRKGSPTGADDKPDAPDPEASQALDLQPRRIEARGTPVVVRAPSQRLNARSERLEYDFESGRIVLDGSEEVFLKHGPDEIHARNLQYKSSDDGRLGEAVAEGPGWLRGQVDEESGQQLFARWGKLLHLRPFEGQPVISLTGDASLEYGYIGQMTAGEIHLYLHESPPNEADPADQPRIRPDRMVALHQVRPNSLQLSGALEEWKVWFVDGQPVEATEGSRGSDVGDVARADRTGSSGEVDPNRRQAGSARERSPLLAATSDAGVLAGPHFEIIAESLETCVMIRDGQSEVSDLTVQGNVRLTQTRTSTPDERPLKLTAEFAHVEHASQPYRTVTVTGSPAHFEARGLGLTGSNINLNSGTNRLWVDGPGWMDLPMDRDPIKGHPLKNPGRLKVEWQRRMSFDGRTARFEESVLATSRQESGQSHLETETLDVSFLRPIRFADLDEQPETQVERIRCHGGAFTENHSFEEQVQVSLDRMHVAEMDINLVNGVSKATGPGRMTSVRFGSSDLLSAGAGDGSPLAPRGPIESDDDGLKYLNVQFEGSLSGNVHNREMTFYDQVKTVYGPVDSWQVELNPNDPDGLGPRGVLLNCNQLSVAQMPLPTGDGHAVEMAAEDNVVVEGQTFTARAPRMTYADAKQLLILEGNGRTGAELYRQEHVGGPFSEFLAQKILYWHSTGQVHVEGARSLKSN